MLEAACGLDHAAHFVEHRARAPHDLLASGGDHDVAAIALEQPRVEQRLELAQLPAEARLRDVTGARSAVEAPVVGDGDGVFELAQRGHRGHESLRLSERQT
jgi:hypothetical protein